MPAAAVSERAARSIALSIALSTADSSRRLQLLELPGQLDQLGDRIELD
jgi:hypothetical protein